MLDISEAIRHIEQFTSPINNFSDYEKDILRKRAVERELEIIGEAMRRILDLDEDIGIQHARRIVDLRNRVIHGYDKVDDAVIWGILQKHIPELKREIDKFLHNPR